jgi:hypothetical protein
VLDPRLGPTRWNGARHVEEAAFIDDPATIGYEAHLRRVDVDASHGEEADPLRCREWLLRESTPCGVFERRTAEV